MIQPKYLFELVRVVNGEHNDLIKNHKMILCDKLRDFISFATKKRYSLNLEHSREDDVNSEFFRKLNPHRGDDEPSMERNEGGIKNENNSVNFVIKNYIDVEVNKNSDENQTLNTANKIKINEENFIKIDVENHNNNGNTNRRGELEKDENIINGNQD